MMTRVTHPANKSQHPGTVDDWTNPDDTITGAEKLKIREEKKSAKAETAKQQNMGKIKVAELEDQMRHEDLTRDLTANHPKALGSRTKDVSATNRTPAPASSKANISLTPDECTPDRDEKNPEDESVYVTPHMERERRVATKAQTERSKSSSVNFTEGSGDNSSGFEPEPEDDKPSEEDDEASASEVKDHASEAGASAAAQKGKNSKKAKTAVRASIAALRFTNTAIGTPTSVPSIKRKGGSDDEQRFPGDTTSSKKQKSNLSTMKSKGGLVQGWKKSRQPKQENVNGDSLAQPGGPIGDNEDPQVEFLDIIKSEDNKHLNLVKVTPKDPTPMTATQACGGAKKWTLVHLDTAMHDVFPKKLFQPFGVVDKFFTPGTYVVAAKGPIFGLMGYRLNDARHNFGSEAVKRVQVFFDNYSSELSSSDQVVQFVEWFIEPDKTMKTAPFMWKSYEFGDNETIRKSGLFRHELIVNTLALAHYSVLPPINDPKTTARPIGALLLSIQAVERVLLMWKSGSFANDAPEFSRQNYDDFKDNHVISIEERAKRGDAAKRKTVKIKHVSKWLKTLNSWTDDKWEALLQDVKTAVSENMGKGKCRGGSGARSSSPIEIVEEDSDGEIPASDPPDMLADVQMDVDIADDTDLDESK
ncbi:hypothetical protein F5146DRAFT_1224428 [Armillaria mellea]|nr:hypothetical protein F5146DRAFT_1224428 [Armillaria mellea]